MFSAFFRFAAGAARRVCVFAAAVLVAVQSQAIVRYSNDYRSPRNPERGIRKSTTLIILHTTEAPARSSLNKLSQYGEAHYCVVENGTVYRIVDRDREAVHAGRSMWNGKSNVDEFSVGIEVVGYHNKQPTLLQLSALKELLVELKALYGIDDAHVLCHSHVAYGAPNKWHLRSHRGRKQCGMLFAMGSVRTKLGLTQRPSYDPDVRAKRLVQADKYLEKVLYGREDLFSSVYGIGNVKGVSPTAPSKVNPAAAVAANPSTRQDSAVSRLESLLKDLGAGRGGKSADRTAIGPAKADQKPVVTAARPPAARKPAANRPAASARQPATAVRQAKPPASAAPEVPDGIKVLGTHGKTIYEVAGNEAASPRTIIVKTDGTFCRGSELTRTEAAKLHVGTKVLLGYAVGGPVSAGNGPIKICGSAWKLPTTYYLVQGTLVPGDKVDDRRIRAGTYIFHRQ